MAKLSAGLLLVDHRASEPLFLLVHPGGPFWRNKDAGAWSIPKGEHLADDDPLTVAEREFEEELGVSCPPGPRHPLGAIRQAGGKVVTAWAVEGRVDIASIVSNTFEIEWPPRSGRRAQFPEVDRAEYFALTTASAKIVPGQRPLLERAAAIEW